MREGLFLQKQNITEWGPVVEAAQAAGLDLQQLERDVKGEARLWFQEDLDLAQAMGVRRFPTLFFINSAGQQERIYGALPYGEWEKRIRRLAPQGEKRPYPQDAQSLFDIFPSLSSREFSELSGTPRDETDAYLQRLHEDGELIKFESRNGPLWKSASCEP